jgi:hypothetical protein
MRTPRTIVVAAAVLAAGLLAAACGNSSASPTSSSTTSTAPTPNITPRAWLTANAAHWSARLNGDQSQVNAAAGTATGVSSSTYFQRLTAACTKLRADAQQAMDVPKAPTGALQSAWHSMLAATETYASQCLTLAHSNSTAAVNEWQSNLAAMNDANATFNRVANAAAKPSSGTSSGTSSTTTSTTSGSSH